MASGYCHLQLMGAIEYLEHWSQSPFKLGWGNQEYGFRILPSSVNGGNRVFRTLVSVSFQTMMGEIKNMASGYCHLQLMGAIQYLEHWYLSPFKLG